MASTARLNPVGCRCSSVLGAGQATAARPEAPAVHRSLVAVVVEIYPWAGFFF